MNSISFTMRPAVVRGERVFLSPMMREDVRRFWEWLHDEEVARYLLIYDRVYTLEDEMEWYERARRSGDYHFSVVTAEGELIGNCSLMKVNRRDRNAEAGIAIFNRDYIGRGYGTEAMKLLLDFAFLRAELHMVYLRVFAFNERGIRSYRKVGFRESGRIREARLYRGRYHDVILMDITREEFLEKYYSGGVD